MKSFIDKGFGVVRKYTLFDWGVFKWCAISAGILLGTYFAQFFIQYINIVWVTFAVTYAWLIYKTFFKYWNK